MTNPTRTEIMQGCVDGSLAERFAFAERLLELFGLPVLEAAVNGVYMPPLALLDAPANRDAPGQLFHVEHLPDLVLFDHVKHSGPTLGTQLDLLDRDAPPVVHDVVLPPLPVIATDWFPIADADYARPLPERIGYYELRKRDGGAVERRWFNGTNWSCTGGAEPWLTYDGWRGCTTPAPLPAVEVLPTAELPVPEKKWLEMDGSAQPELPTLSPMLKYYDPVHKTTWSGRGKMPKWLHVVSEDMRGNFAISRAGSHMVDANGVIVGKVVKK